MKPQLRLSNLPAGPPGKAEGARALAGWTPSSQVAGAYWQTVEPYRTDGAGCPGSRLRTTFAVAVVAVGGTPGGGGAFGVPFIRPSSATKLLPPRPGSGSACMLIAAMRLSRKMR